MCFQGFVFFSSRLKGLCDIAFLVLQLVKTYNGGYLLQVWK